jgi:hypothetical protein
MVERFEKGAIGVIGHAIGTVLRSGAIGFVIGAVLVEAAGAALDKPGHFEIGGTFVQITSAAFGLALGFAFAMTTALVEGVKGLVEAARALEGDAQKAVGAGLGDVGRAAGSVVQGIEHKK